MVFNWISGFIGTMYVGDFSSPVAWSVYCIGGLATLLFIAVSVGYMVDTTFTTDEYRWFGVGYSGVIAVSILWPFLAVVLAFSLPIALVGFVGYCWFKMIPPKAQRIAKREHKRDMLNAQIAEAKESLT